MKKKMYALVLATALGLSLVACGSSEENKSEAETITAEETDDEIADQSDGDSQSEEGEVPRAGVAADNGIKGEILFFDNETVPMQYVDQSGNVLLDYSYETMVVTDEGYDALNEALEIMTDTIRTELEEEYDADTALLDGGELTNDETLPWTDNYTIEIESVNSNYTCFWVVQECYLGGAHGSYVKMGHLFNSKTGDELNLEDIVSDYDGLYENVVNLLEENKDEYGLFDDYADTVYSEFYDDDVALSYVILDDTIVIYFNTYDIAPYASGPIEVDIPMSEFPVTIPE